MNSNDIFISILCSLVASVIVVVVSKLFKFGSKGIIRKKLDYIETCVFVFEHAVYGNDYPTALSQANIIQQSIISIYDDIYPLTFCRSKRRLFNTYLYHIYYIISLSKEYQAHTDEPQFNMEKHCKRIQSYLEYNTAEVGGPSSVMSALLFLKKLVGTNDIRSAFRAYYGYDKFNDLAKIIHQDELGIGYDSFSCDNLTRNEFERIMKKYNHRDI